MLKYKGVGHNKRFVENVSPNVDIGRGSKSLQEVISIGKNGMRRQDIGFLQATNVLEGRG